VRVRVGAIGLNRFEALYRKGLYRPAPFPSRIGAEAAGVVEAIGPGVSSLKVGDRVATLTGIAMERYGTYGEELLYPADMLVQIADGQSLADAASCWMQYVTAYALVNVAAVGSGDAVVITAASSSVGIAAIQIANAHKAMPIAVTRGRGKAAALSDAGAAHVIVSNEEDVAARICEVTGGQGARIAFDAVGGTMLSTLAHAAAPGGIIISYGVLAGLPSDFPLITLLANNLTLRGWSADILTHDPALRAEVTCYVSRGLANGALHPVIDRAFDLAQIADAHRYLESNVQFGKVIVTTKSAHE
jgi:NADPH:quinone reductase-like Zn-dependent oxidoreductase